VTSVSGHDECNVLAKREERRKFFCSLGLGVSNQSVFSKSARN
jgi:hypothetical protein